MRGTTGEGCAESEKAGWAKGKLEAREEWRESGVGVMVSEREREGEMENKGLRERQ